MSEYKTVKDIELRGKRVFLRLDLNVPLKDGKVKDATRIDASLPTIKYVIKKGGRAILASHLGRPNGQKNPEFSLKPVAEELSKKLGKKVVMASDCIGEEVERLVNSMADGEIVLIENLRYYAGEEENDPAFVASLARLCDVYVNDAFGTAHRAHASTYGLPLFLKSQKEPVAAGLLMDEELQIWAPIVKGTGDFVAIIGGAKLEEKMKAVEKMAKVARRIIIGGVVANVFLKATGYEIGDSIWMEKKEPTDFIPKATEILRKFSNVAIPKKVTVATAKDQVRKGTVDPKDGLMKGDIIADVLPTADDLDSINKAKRIVWFGPLGWYEKGFTEGSYAIIEAINRNKTCYAVIGGGDLAAVASGIKAKISTGGGASIQYITKGMLEALEALK